MEHSIRRHEVPQERKEPFGLLTVFTFVIGFGLVLGTVLGFYSVFSVQANAVLTNMETYLN